jgi:hypothetical protein
MNSQIVELPRRPKPSPRQLNANRANAQKSSGPKTPEGKTKAARNSVRHGLAASTFLIITENPLEFQEVRAGYYARLGPRDRMETDLVDRIVRAEWNQRRCWTVENESLNLEIVRRQPDIAAQYVEIPPQAVTALAAQELAKVPCPCSTATRPASPNDYQRALKTLLELRKNFPLAPPGGTLPGPIQALEPAPCQTDPIPKSDSNTDSNEQPPPTPATPATSAAPAQPPAARTQNSLRNLEIVHESPVLIPSGVPSKSNPGSLGGYRREP